MEHSRITISRQRGSGADEIAALVAQRLELPLYDRQVLTLAAAEAGVSDETIASAERRESLLQRVVDALATYAPLAPEVPVVLPPDSAAGAAWRGTAAYRELIEQTLQRLADAGPCVIVGHGAAQVALRGRPDAFHVFLHAPFEQRVRRMMVYGRLGRAEAEQDVRERDNDRVAFFRRHYNLDWYDLRFYDLVINTGGRTFASVADQICAAVYPLGVPA